MDQKDSNTSSRKLASAAELRGKKSGKSGDSKGGKKMWLSLVLLVVLLGAAVGIYYLSGIVKPEEATTPEATLPPSTTVKVVDRAKEDVESVTVAAAGETPFTIVSNKTTTGEGEDATTTYTYEVEGAPDFKLDQSQAGSIIGYAANLTATQQVAEGVTDFGAYGLDKPSATATMNYRDGSQVVWNFGSKIPTGSGYYMCQQGTSTVFVVYSSAYTALSSKLNDLYVLEVPVSFESSASVTNLLIEQKDKATVELRYIDSNETTFSINTLKLVQPIEYDAQSERAEEIIEACLAMTISGYAGQKADLPEAGLDDPRARVVISDANGNTLTCVVGEYCGNDQVYVQMDDTDAVYLMDASLLTFLDNANVSYLVDQFSNLVNILMVDGVEVVAGDNRYEMSIERQPDLDEDGNQKTNAAGKLATIDTYRFDGEEREEALFKKLYQVVIGTMVSKVSDDFDIEGDVVASITYKLNVEPGEFKVEYLEYDENYYAVRRDGLTLFLIKQDKVDNLLDNMESFRNGTFVPED